MSRWMMIAALLLLVQPVQADLLAITNARVHTVDVLGTLDGATVLIRNGRIQAVGKQVRVPAHADVIDAGGADLTPGLFVGLSTLGLREVNAVAESNDHRLSDFDSGAGFSIGRAVNPNSMLYGVARAAGVTRAMVGPAGGAQVFAGAGTLIRLDGGNSHADLAQFVVLGSEGGERTGGSRAAALQQLERGFAEARRYAELSDREVKSSDFSFSRWDLEALHAFMESGQPLAVHADRASDIVQALDIVSARNIPMVLIGGAEAWKVAGALTTANVPVLLDPLGNLPSGFDRLGARADNATLLHAAGVRVGIMESSGHDVGRIRQYAGNAVAEGMPFDAALAAITRTPAEIWGVGDSLGRIAPGVSADLVLWSGDPLEVTTWAERVWIEGREVSLDSRQLQLRDRYSAPASAYR